MNLLLLDIGNTNTHIGWATESGLRRQMDLPSGDWKTSNIPKLAAFLKAKRADGAALCSVVPAATSQVVKAIRPFCRSKPLQLTHATLRGVGIDYPKPETIGPDRLANATAAAHFFGAPAVVVDFGTAVTFDIVDAKSNYIGGVIAPGLAAMTDYLHEKTALLPKIKIREIKSCIGRNTEEAMLIGAVHGYRGLIRELLNEIRTNLKAAKLPVVATGGYAKLMAAGLPEISAVEPGLTLEGLRLVWLAHAGETLSPTLS